MGFGTERRGSDVERAIGGIFGVYRQARIEERGPPMALSQSALSELLDAFRAGEGVDLIRESVRMVMQELIETEATEQIGAGRYERTEARTTERNGGVRPRLVATQASDVPLRIPETSPSPIPPPPPPRGGTRFVISWSAGSPPRSVR